MASSSPVPAEPSDLDAMATTLLRWTSLTRSLMRTSTRELSRTEAGLLSTLKAGPRTINDLAETEALAQPSVSKLVDRLERRGFVARQRDPADGRVVIVTLTTAGSAAYTQLVGHLRDELRNALGTLSQADLATLLTAGEVLEILIHHLHHEGTPA